jgi:hypothetical protein
MSEPGNDGSTIAFCDLREWDVVRISGWTEDWAAFDRAAMRAPLIHVVDLYGTIGTAQWDEDESGTRFRTVKVWPDEDQPYNESGKIWFREDRADRVLLIDRYEEGGPGFDR